MNIYFYATFSNQDEFLASVKKKFKSHKIFTKNDNIKLDIIDVALVWKLPNKILKKLTNLKIIFSLGAGVDHILNLPSYQKIPIIRIKDPNMRSRMFNHVLSQILNYQLKLNDYRLAQNKQKWLDEKYTLLNKRITIGVLGLGYIGSFVAKKLQSLDYKVIGYKNSRNKSKISFPVYHKNSISTFLRSSDIIVSILPATPNTKNIINTSFLNQLKKNCLLINIGRGSSLNEDDLIKHLKKNKNFFASLDVFIKEPLLKKHQFWKNPNVTVTPHIAAVTDVDSSIDYIFKKLEYFRKKRKIKSDVFINRGY